MARDLVIISKHDKGFWQADLYRDGCAIPSADWEEIGPTPDAFFTMRRGQSSMDAMHKAQEKWPSALINLVARRS